VPNGGVLYPLNSTSLELEPGQDAIVMCRATATGNSSYMLSWSPLDHHRSLSRISLGHWPQNLEEDLKDLCRDRSGTFHLSVTSDLGPDWELDREGAWFLLHRAALLVCNASPSLTGSFACLFNTSSESHNIFYLHVFSGSGQLRLIVALVVSVFATCLGAVVLGICLLGYCRRRSYKHSSLRMARCHALQQQPHPRGPSSLSSLTRPSAFNQSFFEDSLHNQEFSREKLRLLSVLGKVES